MPELQHICSASTCSLRQAASAVLDINTRCSVTVLDKAGRPLAGIEVIDMRTDGQYEELQTNGAGYCEFIYGAASKFWRPNRGPHTVYVGDPGHPAGDQVESLGLPEGHHAEYALTFMLAAPDGPVVPPIVPPGTAQTVRGTLRVFGASIPFEVDLEV